MINHPLTAPAICKMQARSCHCEFVGFFWTLPQLKNFELSQSEYQRYLNMNKML